MIRTLIVREEPFLANPRAEAVFISSKEKQNPFGRLEEMVKELQKEFPGFIGLSIFGSFSKGYWVGGASDLDCGLICHLKPDQEEKLATRLIFELEKRGFEICKGEEYLLNLHFSPQHIKKESLEIAFNGLFIGDRQRLIEIQRRIIENISREMWDKIRDAQKSTLAYYKLVVSFGFSLEEAKRVGEFRKYLWSLPDYETAKKYIGLSDKS